MEKNVTALFTTAGIVTIVVLLVAVIEFLIDRFIIRKKIKSRGRRFFLSLSLSFMLSWFVIDQLYIFSNMVTHGTLVIIKTFEIFALTYAGKSLVALISKKIH